MKSIRSLAFNKCSWRIGIARIFAAGSHIKKTVCACFAVLCHLRSVRWSVPRSVLQSLVTSLVLMRLDYGNANLAGALYLLKRLQSVMAGVIVAVRPHHSHFYANCTG